MRGIVCRVGQPPEVEELESVGRSVLRSLQRIVGGYVDCIDIGSGIDCWVNDEGRLLDLPVNRLIPAVAPRISPSDYDFVVHMDDSVEFAEPGEAGFYEVRGDFVLLRHDGQGNSADVTDADIEEFSRLFAPAVDSTGHS